MNNLHLISLDKYNKAKEDWQRIKYKQNPRPSGNAGIVTGEKNNIIAVEVISPTDISIDIPENTPVIASEIYNPSSVRTLRAPGFLLFRLNHKDIATNTISTTIKIHAEGSYIPMWRNTDSDDNMFLLNGNIKDIVPLPNELAMMIPKDIWISAKKKIIIRDNGYWLVTQLNKDTQSLPVQLTNWTISNKTFDKDMRMRLVYSSNYGNHGHFVLNLHLLKDKELYIEMGQKSGLYINIPFIKDLRYIIETMSC